MVELTDISLYLPQLPESMEGVCVVHAGDLHSCCYGRREKILHRVMKQGCDVMIFSGDFCHQVRIGNLFAEGSDQRTPLPIGLSRHGYVFEPHIDEAVALCKTLLNDVTCRLGVYAVQGNHDPYAFMAKLGGLGVTVLDNQTSQVSGSNGEHFNLCGVSGYGRDASDVPGAALGIDPNLFTLAVSHYPEMAPALAAVGADVILSGHTHGGQICLPGRRAILTHSRTGSRHAVGLNRVGDSYVYTTRGLGTSLLPIRTFCPPEIVRYTLHRGDSAKTIIKWARQ